MAATPCGSHWLLLCGFTSDDELRCSVAPSYDRSGLRDTVDCSKRVRRGGLSGGMRAWTARSGGREARLLPSACSIFRRGRAGTAATRKQPNSQRQVRDDAAARGVTSLCESCRQVRVLIDSSSLMTIDRRGAKTSMRPLSDKDRLRRIPSPRAGEGAAELREARVPQGGDYEILQVPQGVAVTPAGGHASACRPWTSGPCKEGGPCAALSAAARCLAASAGAGRC